MICLGFTEQFFRFLESQKIPLLHKECGPSSGQPSGTLRLTLLGTTVAWVWRPFGVSNPEKTL